MAIGSSVPPRAYTRDILTTAFNWLQTQPEAVRTKATTPDALVGLYMQSNRAVGYRSENGQTSLEIEAPVSSQAFMSDLKNLAEGLKEFDGSKASRTVEARPATSAEPKMSTSAMTQAAVQTTAPAVVAQTQPVAQASAPVLSNTSSATHAPSSSIRSQQLNDRSLAMLREVQFAMNLSSETEAMNLMIAVAHKNLKGLLS